MHLDEKAQFLIAVGAALAAHCERCLGACIGLARQAGADEGDIRTAMAIGRKIMRCAARQAADAGARPPAGQGRSDSGC